ncbi:hypothetical protein KIM372_00310 [Bombiscardovia nodaiensis]|uniref:ATP-dependent helicase Rep n=1 Tax=Bombiscardovia nodaiensis TaxID=2932181 RepID=A0ABN6S7J6_9BIFI|nr:hypothetical protein KIM372_00310 [Bombiscardovia nodaiensis]
MVEKAEKMVETAKNGGKHDARSRAWFFTISAEAEDDIPTRPISLIQKALGQYEGADWVFQLEKGKQDGYLHYQAALLLPHGTDRRWSDIKRDFTELGMPDAHIEKTRKVGAASRYCAKSDTRLGGPWWSSDAFKAKAMKSGGQGQRVDRDAIRQAVESGMTPADIMLDEDLGVTLSADNRGYADSFWASWHSAKWMDANRDDIQVFYLYGPTGCGKTTFVRSLFPRSKDLFSVRFGGRDPWGNYRFQPVLLMDEFREDCALKDLLVYLDRFPIELDRRYSNIWAAWSTVFICSNWPLSAQYRNASDKDKAALHRRITAEIDMSVPTEQARLADLVKAA